MEPRPRLFTACLMMAACTLYLADCHAQSTGYITPEDYYIYEYYLRRPPRPPEVVKKETVSTTVTNTGTGRIARSFRQMNTVSKMSTSFSGTFFQPKITSGPMFDSLIASLDISSASVDDETIGGSGSDRDAGFLLTGTAGDSLAMGLGYSHNWYRIGGPYNFSDELSLAQTDYRQQTDSIDMFATWMLDDTWAVGVFLNQSWVDVEDVWRLDTITLLKQNIGDSFSRWGGGLLLSMTIPISSNANLGVTNTISSMNKRSVGRLFDDEDSAWLFMVDWNQGLTDSLSVNAYVTLFNLLDPDKDTPDGSYLILGLDASYRLSDSTSISLGVDTTSNDNDREEQRLNVGLVVEF